LKSKTTFKINQAMNHPTSTPTSDRFIIITETFHILSHLTSICRRGIHSIIHRPPETRAKAFFAISTLTKPLKAAARRYQKPSGKNAPIIEASHGHRWGNINYILSSLPSLWLLTEVQISWRTFKISVRQLPLE
jgi:hypothetical protein